jgi:hypothetical protein
MPVKETLFAEIDGQLFLKLRGSYGPLIRMICYDIVVPKNASLLASEGFKQLVQLRNEASGLVMPTNALMAGAAAGSAAQPLKKKAKTCGLPEGNTVAVSLPAGTVTLGIAKYKNEDIMIKFSESNLALVFDYIKASDLSFGDKCEYVQSGKFAVKDEDAQ